MKEAMNLIIPEVSNGEGVDADATSHKKGVPKAEFPPDCKFVHRWYMVQISTCPI